MNRAYRLGLMHSVGPAVAQMKKEAGRAEAKLLLQALWKKVTGRGRQVPKGFFRETTRGVFGLEPKPKATTPFKGTLGFGSRKGTDKTLGRTSAAAGGGGGRAVATGDTAGAGMPKDPFKKVDIPLGVPEGGPLLPNLLGRLGQAISTGAYHVDPGLQRLLIGLAGGAKSPTTARVLGSMPAMGLGAAYMMGDDEPEQLPYNPIASGYLPPTMNTGY